MQAWDNSWDARFEGGHADPDDWFVQEGSGKIATGNSAQGLPDPRAPGYTIGSQWTALVRGTLNNRSRTSTLPIPTSCTHHSLVRGLLHEFMLLHTD